MLNSAKTISHVEFVSLATVFSVAVLAISPAAAHEAPVGWKYPWACCANHDCQQLSDTGISERKDGYVVNKTGEVVAYADKRVKDSPDGLYHWCAHRRAWTPATLSACSCRPRVFRTRAAACAGLLVRATMRCLDSPLVSLA